jgi:hypothetical protein
MDEEAKAVITCELLVRRTASFMSFAEADMAAQNIFGETALPMAIRYGN